MQVLLLITDQAKKKANEVKKEIEAMGSKAITVKADISNYEDCKKILKETLDAFGTC